MTLLLRAVLVLTLALTLDACATRKIEPYLPPPPEQALPAQADSAFAEMESGIREAHGPDASGFRLIDRNEDGLRWRLALIDSARYSISDRWRGRLRPSSIPIGTVTG